MTLAEGHLSAFCQLYGFLLWNDLKFNPYEILEAKVGSFYDLRS